MELAKELFAAFGLKEDPSKNDISFVKRGLAIELREMRDIAGHVQVLSDQTTVAAFKALLEGLVPGTRIGHVVGVVSATEECPRFLTFLKKQAKRLKFKLIVFESPLPPDQFGSSDQVFRDRGFSRMQ
jgi:hypothetical protein